MEIYLASDYIIHKYLKPSFVSFVTIHRYTPNCLCWQSLAPWGILVIFFKTAFFKSKMFKVPMKRKLSLSFLKENLKWQSNIFCSFGFPCFVFEIFEFVWYVNLTDTITLRHTHNDLSQKIIYLCYCQTKTLNIYRLCCRGNTRTWFLIRQVLLFDNNKDM